MVLDLFSGLYVVAFLMFTKLVALRVAGGFAAPLVAGFVSLYLLIIETRFRCYQDRLGGWTESTSSPVGPPVGWTHRVGILQPFSNFLFPKFDAPPKRCNLHQSQ